jgi:hypothetical protein
VGFSHSWIAIRGGDKAALLEQLGLAEVGPGDLDVALNGFGLAELPGGWLLVLCNDFEFPGRSPLEAVSRAGDVVSCAIEEHVMFSEARGFAGGVLVWRATHDSEKGILDLSLEGKPPEALAEIHAEALRDQEKAEAEGGGVDYVFDVPPRLAEQICGFFLGEGEPDFIELRRIGRRGRATEPSASSGPGFFQRLFGRR